ATAAPELTLLFSPTFGGVVRAGPSLPPVLLPVDTKLIMDPSEECSHLLIKNFFFKLNTIFCLVN
ncbi:hypothetical protein AB9H28_23795, partial [Salmonella enterica subsp. enterica serovar Kentucky]|uniref:hypothetical protein n=1 Tax=Salmonella enterica TaxID=28901 RepID=UPI003F4B2153